MSGLYSFRNASAELNMDDVAGYTRLSEGPRGGSGGHDDSASEVDGGSTPASTSMLKARRAGVSEGASFSRFRCRDGTSN